MKEKNTMEIKWIAPEEIHPYERNPRFNDQAVDGVAASLREFGWKQPLVCDSSLTIIVGHTRWKAARKLGMSAVPVLVAADLTEEQVKAYRLADNRTGELSEWDYSLLPIELDELKQMNFDMSELGFSEEEIEEILAREDPVTDGRTDPDKTPETPEQPKSRSGALYKCGMHLLLCGDSTNADAVRRLTAEGGIADLWLTDPPYNVDISNSEGLKIKNDNMKADEFDSFLRAAFAAAVSAIRPGAVFYIFYSDSQTVAFRQAVKAAGMQIRQNLIWVKSHFVLGHSDYQNAHEVCLYGWKDGAVHGWYNGRNQKTVIDIDGQPFRQGEDGRYYFRAKDRFYSIAPDAVCMEENTTVIRANKPLKSALHPTMKPVAMLVRLIKNSSRRGEKVLDTFGGSGSTMIACEQTGRQARLIELDPHFVDVIRQRWAEFKHGEGCDWERLTPEVKNGTV